MRLVHLMNLLREGLLCLTKCVLWILRQSATTVMCTTRLFIETTVRVNHLLLLLLHVASLTKSHLVHIQFRNHPLRRILSHISNSERITLNGHCSEMWSSTESKWKSRIRVWTLIYEIVGCFKRRSVAVLWHITGWLCNSGIRIIIWFLFQFGCTAQFLEKCRISLTCSTNFFLRSDL